MTSTVTCDYSGASWEVNSEGQNACQVYAALQGICDPSFTVHSVISSSPAYTPPNNVCGCNLVAYNLMAGCGWCQSAILTTWWLSESAWSNDCTLVPYDSTGLPSNLTAIPVNIPSWAFIQPTGTTWTPSQAQAVASGTVYSDSYSGGYPYNGPIWAVETFFAILAIALACLLGLNLLLGLVGVILHFVRQEKRKRWYGPMARYYENLKFGGSGGGGAAAAVNQPLMYNMNPSAYQNSTSSLAVSPPSNTGYTYQPPLTGRSNGGYAAVPNPAYGVGTNMTSMQTDTIATPGGYKGYAEAY